MEVQSTGYDACDHSIISQISDDIAFTHVSIDNPTHDNLPGTSARLRENGKQKIWFSSELHFDNSKIGTYSTKSD